MKAPELIAFVDAPYPAEALAAGVEGNVLLLLEVDATGTVTRVEVLDPIGYGFDEAAVTAARQFKFRPAEDATGPVPVSIEFEYGFVKDATLRDDAVPEKEAATGGVPNLEGTLVEMGTRRPLASFKVVLDGLGREATTDESGHFSFTDVPAQTVALVVVHPGYQGVSKRVEVTEGEATSVKLWLRNLSYRDDELVGVYQKEQEEVTKRTLTMAEVRRVPGTFGDPVRVIQSLPGAARTPFGTGLLIIRGANPEDTAVYVDGIRVPIIYHLGGFVSVINADLIDTVDYLPGGYGVRYGRSTGGVVDVKTKQAFPERNRVTWSTDLLDSGGLVEGRAGKDGGVGFAIAARRSYIDAFIPLFTADSGFYVKPRWYDYQLKVSAQDLDRGRLSGFLFGFEDVLLVETPDDFAQGTDQDTQGDVGLRYSSHRVVGEWQTPLGEDADLYLSPSVGLDLASFGLGSSFDFSVRQWLVQTRVEAPWKLTPGLQVTPGADIWAAPYVVTITLPFVPTDELDPVGERESFEFQTEGQIWSVDPYVDLDIQPFPDAERAWTLSPGLRLHSAAIFFSSGSAPQTIATFDPRITSRSELTKSGTLKLGTGLFHQPPQGSDLGFNETSSPGFEQAWSTEVGWEERVSEAIQGDVTVFYKELSDLIVDNVDRESTEDQFYVNEGEGRVAGVEVIVRHALVDRFFGWVSYTLSKSERKYPTNDDWIPFEFDQTHILVAVAGYRLPRDFEVSTKFQYVTGNPYTPFDGGVYDADQDLYYPYSIGDVNSERMPPFLELDLRVDKLFTFKGWQLELYADFLNVVRGTNPEAVQYNYDYTESTYIRGLPFLPSPGFQAEFEF